MDEEWGPLDWRLPEASAIYWAALGLEQAKENPDKVNQAVRFDHSFAAPFINPCCRLFITGGWSSIPLTTPYDLLSRTSTWFRKVNDSYETMYAEEPDPARRTGIHYGPPEFPA